MCFTIASNKVNYFDLSTIPLFFVPKSLQGIQDILNPIFYGCSMVHLAGKFSFIHKTNKESSLYWDNKKVYNLFKCKKR